MRYLTFIGLIFLMASCSKTPVPVTYNADFAKAHNVMIDGNIKLTPKNTEQFEDINLVAGEHQVSIDNQPAQKFIVGEKGSLLNLAKDTLIVFALHYGVEQSEQEKKAAKNLEKILTENQRKAMQIERNSGSMPNFLIVDSLILTNDAGYSILFDILKKKDTTRLNQYLSMQAYAENVPKELSIIYGDQLAVPRNWDFGINDPLQQTITQKGGSMMRRKLVTFRSFLSNARADGKWGFVAVPYNTTKVLAEAGIELPF